MTIRHTTIAIPKYRSDLFDSLSGNYLTTQCARYDPSGLLDPVHGMVWCFVEWSQGAGAVEICRHLRSAPCGELFFITAVLDDNSMDASQAAIGAGADECMAGPLTPETLRTRIERRGLQRVEAAGGHVLEIGDYVVDLALRRLYWQGRNLVLRPSEFKLFTALLRCRNRLLSLEEIIAISATEPPSIKSRTVHVWMGRLRRVLNQHGIGDHIRSVRSMGYVLDYPDQAELAGPKPVARGDQPPIDSRFEASLLV